MKLARGVNVDLKVDISIRTVLGFDTKMDTENRNESQHTVDIMRVNSILVPCNLIGSSYLKTANNRSASAFFQMLLRGKLLSVQAH